MNISFAFKNFEPSDHLKKYARRRMEKLSRFMGKSGNAEASVTMSVDKFRHKVEAQISGDNLNITANEQTEDMYSALDLILDKLESQVKRHAEKMKDKRYQPRPDLDVFSFRTEGSGRERTIVGETHFEAKPMFLDEAMLRLGKSDDSFLVFINAETEQVNILHYDRHGKLGLITPAY